MKQRIQRIRRGLLSRFRVVQNAMKYLICRAIPSFVRRETWVICERGMDARDNGYAFYRYLVENQPQIRVHYLITPDSVDYPKVADHAVAFGSWKNYWVVAKADKIISTHCYTALPVKHEKTWRRLGLAKRFYFLQHGIIKEKLPYLFGDKTQMQMFCCAAVPEYQFVGEYFLHPEQVVQCTGLARYDYLTNEADKKQILVMPTWRRYLKEEKDFLESDYFRAWNDLLRDQRLVRYLENTGTRLIFYPHQEFQHCLRYFTPVSEQIILADFAHYDVQQLLKESALLVTDYSSVFFDFAYMEKPCIFYQFDAEQYSRAHYSKGYFQFNTDGFGPVETTNGQLVDHILEAAAREYSMEQIYRDRVGTFFAYRDRSNCERIYRAITER